jgi:hypothetical protein
MVLLLGAAVVAAQGRSARQTQTNPNTSGKRPHVATLHSSDSSEGSRVALNSDQSLNDYEAYRRGDRFYVRIPAADVPNADALRGRGFADVKTQRVGDSIVISFRLQPGATARVEQRGNRIEIVFTVAGGSSSVASNAGRQPLSSTAGPNRNSNTSSRNASSLTGANRSSNTNQRSAPSLTGANRSANNNQRNNSKSGANKNAPDRPKSPGSAANSNLAGKPGTATALAANSGSKAVATPLPSPIPSPTAKLPTPTPVQKSTSTALAAPTTQTTPATNAGQSTNQPRQDRWSQMKERINYWILLAQLNPVPVATGVGVLLLLIGLFLFQRRRAKTPKRVRTSTVKSTTKTKDTAASVSKPSESKLVPEVAPAVEAAIIPTIVAAAPSAATAAQEVASAPVSSPEDDSRRGRIVQATEETKKLINGGPYDENVIGSSDRETRQLVGAELLSAIVGRSAARREYARAAFMKHGYFDDATRDLRIAESPNERAAAARRLSFVHDPDATPHLVAALDDPSPDVRRAAVEALMDIRDPAAIGPLNSLMQTENDRKVPRTLIKHAIEACATATPDESASVPAPIPTPEAMPDPSSHANQTDREVIEL